MNTTMMLKLRVHIRCYTLDAQCQSLPLLARIKDQSTYQVSFYPYAATMSLICHGRRLRRFWRHLARKPLPPHALPLGQVVPN